MTRLDQVRLQRGNQAAGWDSILASQGIDRVYGKKHGHSICALDVVIQAFDLGEILGGIFSRLLAWFTVSRRWVSGPSPIYPFAEFRRTIGLLCVFAGRFFCVSARNQLLEKVTPHVTRSNRFQEPVQAVPRDLSQPLPVRKRVGRRPENRTVSGKQPRSRIQGIHIRLAEDRFPPKKVEELQEKRGLAGAGRSFQQEDWQRRSWVDQKVGDIPRKIGWELAAARNDKYAGGRK